MTQMPRLLAAIAGGVLLMASPLTAQESQNYTTTYYRLSGNAEGYLLTPGELNANSRIALVFSHPNRDNYKERPGHEMAKRGYRVMYVNYRGDRDSSDSPPENYLPSISRGIEELRKLQGVEQVVLLAHSGGTHLGSFYQNVAQNGPETCMAPEKIYPCDPEHIGDLQPADALILLDPTLGAPHQMSAIDPAVTDDGRTPELDMFNPDNGFDPQAKMADYSAEFAQKFYAAQSARNNALIDDALARLKAIDAGEGEYSNDEPLVLNGVGVRALGARLYQPDPAKFAAHTRQAHLLLKGDGTRSEEVIRSVRKPAGNHLSQIKVLGSMNYDTTVRGFLANSAVRTTADYAFTEDDITGVDWNSANSATPGNAAGVTVPALVMAMGCHYLMVPAEIIFNNLASEDKSYAAVEGATHGFTACGDQYGDTVKVTFDYVDEWIGGHL